MKRITLLLFVVILLLGSATCGKKNSKPNILLITIDTLRQDYLGCYGCPLDTSPFIDRLAKEGVLFKHVVTPIPLTDGSHASILTSLHPLVHQVLPLTTWLDDKVETIAETLKKNGYYTIGTVSVKHMSRKYNFDQGFDSYSDDWDKNAYKFNMEWQREAGSVNESVMRQVNEYLEKYKKREKPLFMWVHYYDPHFPYCERGDFSFRNSPIKDSKIDYKYAGEILYTDFRIDELYQFLEQKGLTGRLISCITSDHGEQLGEHGYNGAHNDIYSETIFVPLIFHGYNIPGNKTADQYVSTMDIAETLLGLVNLKFENPVNGIKLFSSDRTPVFPDNKKRDFLIVGNPDTVRSIQLMTPPSTFIYNFDSKYSYSFFSMSPMGTGLQGDMLKPVPAGLLRVKYHQKSNKERISIDYPYALREGLHFAVLQFDVKKDMGFSVGYRLGPGKTKTSHEFEKKISGTFTAYFPITPLDQPEVYINKRKETEIVNLKYGILTRREFTRVSLPKKNVPSHIPSGLMTERTGKKGDELFDLDTDFKMDSNLLETGDFKARIQNERKSVYDYLKFYWDKKMKTLGKTARSKPPTKKELEMLKSLGYL